MSREHEIEKIEITLEHARAKVEEGRKALSLTDNAAFRELILEGYFKDEAARLVRLYAAGTTDKETRGHIERDMHAIGALHRYLAMKVHEGRTMEQAILENEEALQEIRAQGEMNFEDDGVDYAGSLGA